MRPFLPVSGLVPCTKENAPCKPEIVQKNVAVGMSRAMRGANDFTSHQPRIMSRTRAFPFVHTKLITN